MTQKATTFNPNHIFVDTNVLVGGYSGNPRFQRDHDCLHYLYSGVWVNLQDKNKSYLSMGQIAGWSISGIVCIFAPQFEA